MRNHNLSYLLFIFLFLACKQKQTEVPKTTSDVIHCDMEHANGSGKLLLTDIDGITLSGGQLRSKDYAHSGEYSIKMAENDKYALSITLTDCYPDEYFEISVWKYGQNSNVYLVAHGTDTSNFYIKKKQSFITDSTGWQKITLNLFIPPNFREKSFKTYIWKTDRSTCYFDDFKIVKKKTKVYPEYEGEALDILIDSVSLNKIKAKRIEAYEKGILESADNDFVKAKLKYNNDTLSAKIRLKGDWLDHLDGDKWSFRVKMRKNDSFRNLLTFSVQTPESRDFLKEWTVHKLLEKEDILTTRYSFIPLRINGVSKGLYAIEEHFEKQLVESKNRREGPIIKFSEEAFWVSQKIAIKTKKAVEMPAFEVSQILPFKEGKLVENKNLYDNFIIAQNLLYQFKYNLKPAEEIFDMDKMAKFVAIIDFTKAFHALSWHNLRFYYNPVTCRLEPIAYDCYGNNDLPENHPYFIELALSQSIPNYSRYIILHLFENKIFLKKYMQQINKMVLPEYLNSFIREIGDQMKLDEAMIAKEFEGFHYSTDYLFESAERLSSIIKNCEATFKSNAPIKSELKTEYTFNEETIIFMVQAFKNNKLEIINYLKEPVQITGYGANDSLPDVKTKINVPGYHSFTDLFVYDIKNPESVDYLFVKYQKFSFVIKVNPWPAPSANIPIQDFILKNSYRDNKEEIVFSKGNHTIDKTIVIPEGKKVIIQPGAKINIINEAAFISYSPINAVGSENDPIEIYSSDGTANSFTVINAQGMTILKNVVFNQLNTLGKHGWSLTGAVNFYASDVNMDHVTISNNRSEDALNIIRSTFNMTNCWFDNIFADAFDSDFSKGKLSNSRFRDIGNDAIDFSGSEVIITTCKILNAGDKGISGGEHSTLQVSDCQIEKTNIGIASKDLSYLEISNTSLNYCNYGLVAFMKKPEFGPAHIQTSGIRLKNINNEYLIETGSSLLLNGVEVTKKKSKVASNFYVQ